MSDPNRPPTRSQMETMRAIQVMTAQKRRPPKLNELAEFFGCRKQSIQERLRYLRKRGMVEWCEGSMQMLRVVWRISTCAHCGAVRVPPITSEEIEEPD